MPKGVRFKIGNNKIYPTPYYAVGDLYLTTNSENPKNRLGYGVWSLFGPGRCLICVDTSQTEFNTAKKTGGEKTHKLSISEMPNHAHTIGKTNLAGSQIDGYSMTGNYTNNGTYNTSSQGGGQAHNNLQPFITCYIWLRTA